MKLSQLLANANLVLPNETPNPNISGVTFDSRQVKPGFVFVAIPGVPLPTRPPLDGHDFIPQALERGAVAIVGAKDLVAEISVPYISVMNPRVALADLARAYWGDAGAKLKLIGVTGSKGKSTTTALIHHVLEYAGLSAARMSTVGIRYAGKNEVMTGHFTTPEATEVQHLLHRFLEAGCTHAVLEISSHAMALERARGLEFDVGVWVNFINDDHLDFHGNEENYFAAKQTMLHHSRFGILNSDDSRYPQASLPHHSYSIKNLNSDWRANKIVESNQGLSFETEGPLGRFDVVVPMIGAYNVSNALAAIATAAHFGVDVQVLRDALANFAGVPGRMQIVQSNSFRVINDFAHTEASLNAALSTLRQSTTGRLIVVVGAAGERDVARRDGIGRAAAKGADMAVFTEEDCRAEDINIILETMQNAYLAAGGRNHVLIPDRREAMRYAFLQARPGDTVLLSGKGHERTLERATETIPWDETAEALKALANR